MPNKKSIITVIIIFVTIILAANSLFIIEEGNQALVLRNRKISTTYTNAGLNFKIPVIDEVVMLPKKTQVWNNTPENILTKNKESIQVYVTAIWSIVDPVKFYETLVSIESSYDKLDNIFDPQITNTVAAFDRVEIVRSTDEMLENKDFPGTDSTKTTTGRVQIAKIIMESSNIKLEEMGINVVDIVIRKVRLNDKQVEAVYKRMITTRNIVAEEFRSFGFGEKERIIGETDKEFLRISSEARAYEQQAKGNADAEAAKIYAEAYNVDPEFYSFWRALESYKDTLPKFEKTLSTDMEYFQYLYSSK